MVWNDQPTLPMNKPNEKLEAIFEAALALETDAQLADYLNRTCPDPELRREVESLLEAHRNPDSVFAEKTVRVEAPLSEGPDTVIGRYTLLQMIGEGGFGVVYMAEQKEPVRRRVALKIIKLGMDSQQVVARFEAERQALAMMDHPNIARVLDGGCTETGRPYFVMELVKGQSITQYCDEHQLSTRQRLELFIPICQAIQHAHQKGIIHRDLKPSNILVATIDGQPVPKVIDFGIAKATQHDLTDKIVFTQFHQFMGTPAYMSPEQAALDSTDIDTRSDIYSLGVLLYELLTGKTPVEAKELTRGGYDEIRRRIRELEPPRPSQRLTTLSNDELTTVARSRAIEPAKLSKLIRGELDWVVLKAMDKDRSRRYETASGLALDIRRYLDNEPVTAVKPSPIYHLQKFAGRHKVALATAACFALLLAVGACVSAAQAIKNKSLFTAAEEARLKEMSAKQRETELRRIAETERDRSERFLYIADMNLARRAWDEANVGRAVELLEVQRPQPGQPDLRNFEWFYLDRLCHKDLLTLKGHTNGVGSVMFSPDGKQLVSASSRPQTVKVWDATSGREILTWRGNTNMFGRMAFSPDGKQVACEEEVVPGQVAIVVCDALSGMETLRLTGHTDVLVVAFSPDGKRLASGSNDRTVKVWDAATGRATRTLRGHKAYVYTLAFSPDGKRLASSGGDQTAKLWDVESGQELFTLNGHGGTIYGMAFSPDGKRLATASGDRTVKLWDATTGQEALTLKGHSEAVLTVAFSPDGTRLTSGGTDQTVKVWDPASGKELLTLKGHSDPVTSVAFSPDGKRLASAGDTTVKVWDVTDDEEPPKFKGHFSSVNDVAFSPDGKWVATAREDGTVKIWDAMAGQEALTLKGHRGPLTSVAFSPDGKQLASGSWDRTVKVWDAATGQARLRLLACTNSEWNVVYCVAFSPDGKRLAAAAGADCVVRVWDTTSGQQTLTFAGHSRAVWTVAFSPDGIQLASTSDDGTVRVWSATTGRELLTLHGQGNRISSVAFSPDGKWLASDGGGKTVTVWDTASGHAVLTLEGHNRRVNSVAFNPDGRRLASASDDGTIKLWDTMSGQETLTLPSQKGGSGYLVFSPDGLRLAASWGSTVKLWDARPRPQESISEAKTRQ